MGLLARGDNHRTGIRGRLKGQRRPHQRAGGRYARNTPVYPLEGYDHGYQPAMARRRPSRAGGSAANTDSYRAAGGTGQAAVASVSTCSAAAIITDETIP